MKGIYRLIILFLFCPVIAFTQSNKRDKVWLPFESFIGSWEGNGESESGKGKYERSYNFIFNKAFIEIRNKSVYPPNEKSPKGEIHEDIGYISYDRLRKTFVLRQFHIESFVNQYKLDSVSSDGKTIVFVSESIENISPGWRAKETYNIISNDEIIETFALAEPKGDFQTYSKVTLIRTKTGK